MEDEYKEEIILRTGQPVAQPLQSETLMTNQSGEQPKQVDESPSGSITSKEQPENEAQKAMPAYR